MSVRKLFASSALRYRRPPCPRALRISTSPSPEILPADILIEEETTPGYNPESFYPANPGDLLNSRYKIVAKIGWGTTSTVWLAEDTQGSKQNSSLFVTVKIAVSDVDEDTAKHELNITRFLETNPSHPGYSYIRTMLDNFEVIGPRRKHICLVYKPMREPLWMFQERMPDRKIPLALLKAYLRIFLRGLEYLHSECHIVHTDLKVDNILMGFEHPSVIEEFVQKQHQNPMARKIKDSRTIYRSHDNFGPFKSYVVLPIIADFGLAQAGDSSKLLRYPIQAHVYHAPEVLLGTGWTYSADIWNLGVLIWNMLEGKDLFQHFRSSKGEYDAQAHLAEMVALLGLPPKELLDREALWSKVKWGFDVRNSKSVLCETAREYFGGPFFTPHGQFKRKEMIPTGVSLESSVLSLEGKDKQSFLNFVRKMLQWLPEDRKTAKELLEDPWLIMK